MLVLRLRLCFLCTVEMCLEGARKGKKSEKDGKKIVKERERFTEREKNKHKRFIQFPCISNTEFIPLVHYET